MTFSRAASRSPLLRLVLRGGLLGGSVLDLALALLILGSALGATQAAGWLAAGVPEPDGGSPAAWLLVPPLVARGIVQALACYDGERYGDLVPWIAATLVAGAVLAYRFAPTLQPGPAATAAGVLGLVQLVSWKATRA